MIKRTLLAVAMAATVGTMVSSASATLLLYEPFDYADAALNGNGGALGTTGTWSTTDTGFGNGWWNHPGGATSGQVWDPGPDATLNTPDDRINIFDGTYGNLPSTGGWAGTAAPGDKGLDPWTDNGSGNLDGSIGIDPSVTATFQSNTTTWFSYVTARAWDRNEGTPQVLLATTASSGGSRGLSLNGGDGLGAGGGPSRFNLQDIYPQYFEQGVNNHAPGGYDYPSLPYPANAWNVPSDARGDGTLGTNNGEQIAFGSGNNVTARGQLENNVQNTPSARLDANGDFGDYNVVVMKIEWDADAGKDAISVVAFSSTDTITEAEFDARIAAQPQMSSWNWTGKDEMVTSVYDGNMYQVTYDDNKPDLDQSTFNLINIQSLKFYIDELRLATTFDEVIGVGGCNPGDTDGDGDIDTADLTTSIQNFTGAGGSTTKTCEEGDTDDDGDVDTADLTFSIQNFTGAQAGNAGVPDLVYDPATGNVTIDADGADVISFSLQSGPFNAADFSELPAGLTDNIASQIGWTSFNLFSGLTGTADLGAILPAGLDLAGLEAALTTASYGLALAGGGGGGRLDLIIPEPASMVLMGLGAVALVRRRRAA